MLPAQCRFGALRAPRISLLFLLAALVALVSVPLSGGASSARRPSPAPQVHAVTLITGDVVRLVTRPDGSHAVSLEPGIDGTVPRAAITKTKGHLYVIPHAASRLLAAKRLDLDLFDVLGLVEQRYDDERAPTLPVVVDYGSGNAAGDRARSSSFAHAQKTHALTLLGAAAFAANKHEARKFWRSLTTGRDATGASTGLAGGATRVDLDGRVRALLDVSVPHIHAPEAWAAGFDGAGTTVAVLDSGIDLAHPDLVGKVTATANFSAEASVADGNGHGTHVASTIAGSGAASSGLRKGVAPGSSLMIGKVLGDDGFGEDSAVLAGMQWAVASGADVVNMSLGGDVTDGTDPLSLAIDELSAGSDTLFVVAAGNNGGPSTVTAPGAAKAALTVGAVDDSDAVAYFSSRGPRLGDAGVKPDVAAPGVSIAAARAAGTALGVPLDDWYTELEGTSMATPHVAGLAAILKDQHPDWDGERIKAVIAGSAVPLANATAYEVGTGLVDAQRAIGRTVVAEGTLDLGFFPYPQSSLPSKRTPLGYRNLGSSPVTLQLAVAAQDGTSAPPPGVTLSASEVTVPAGGRVAVDVVLDPAAAALGVHSGVIVARSPGTEIRTALGFELETERYDLTVEIDPRAGTQRASHTVGLIDQGTGAYDQRFLAGPGTQSVTFRVPPGDYSVGTISFGLAADGASEGVLSYRPRLRLEADAKVVLDEDDTKAFGVRTDRPVATDGQIMSVDWSGGEAAYATFVLAGQVDRLYALPFQDPSGHVDSRLNWMLSQPDAELTPPARGPVPLRSVVPSGARWSALPVVSGRFELVNAGSVATLDTSRAHRSVAVVSSECEDVTGAVAALRAAGAVAVVAYAAAGAECAGTLAEPAGLPVYQARPFDAARLLESAGKPVGLAPHTSPRYVYDLMGAWGDSVPNGATLDGTSKQVAALVQRYESLNTDANRDYDVWDMQLGWLPASGTAAFGLVRPVAVPGVVTHYLSPIAEWEPIVDVRDASGVPQALFSSPRRRVTAGETVHDRWFGGPLVTNVSPLMTQDEFAAPYRQGDYLFLVNLPTWTDDAGHIGYPGFGEFEGRLYADGELLLEGDNPLWLQGPVAAERHEYRLVETTHRQNGFWQRSTTTESEWTFSSARPEGDLETLPLMVVDYDLPLSSTSTAPAGTAFSFDVRFGMPARVEVAALTTVRVEISWDGGATWADATLRNCALGKPGRGGAAAGCTAQVRNADSGSASLRVSATDAAGRSVTQTIVDAYAVAR